MANKNEREYRSMMLEIEQKAEGEEEERMVVSGYASTFDDPYKLWEDDNVEVWRKSTAARSMRPT